MQEENKTYTKQRIIPPFLTPRAATRLQPLFYPTGPALPALLPRRIIFNHQKTPDFTVRLLYQVAPLSSADISSPNESV
jgi:hypothetical protein